jgi:hypothetical protein
VVCPFNRILLTSKKEQNSESPKPYDEWKKPVTKDFIPCDLYVCRDGKSVTAYLGLG